MLQIFVVGYFHRLQNVHQGLAVEPGCVLTPVNDVVAFEGRQWHEANILQAKLIGKRQVVVLDFIEAFFAEINQIHFVHCDHDVANAKQRGNVRVAAGLGQNAVARIDHQDRNLSRRCPCRHVASVLLVAGSVCDDELALIS